MRLTQRLTALQHRDYRLYFGGQLISQCGSWMQTVGQSWLVLQLTDSPFKLGLISALQWLPTLFLCLVAGAVADRVPKRKLLLFTQSTQMLTAFTLFTLVHTGVVQYWHVAIAAVCLGLATAFDVPTRQAFVVEMVGKEDLGNAIVLNSAMMNSARLIGPAVAGVVVAWKGEGFAFLCNGLSFLAVLTALLCMEAEGLPKSRQKSSLLHDVAAGLRYVGSHHTILLLLGLILVIGLTVFNFNVTIPLLATYMLGLDARGYGALMSAMGAGALTSALVLSLMGRRKPKLGLVATAALVFAGLYFALGLVRLFPLAMAMIFLVGVCNIQFTSQINTLLQMTVSDEMRGRVMAMYALTLGGTTPLGSLLMGGVTERLGAPYGFFVGGGLGMTGVLLILAWWLLKQRAQPSAPGRASI